MDVRLSHGWWFRYSFSETMSSNPISDELPAGPARFEELSEPFRSGKALLISSASYGIWAEPGYDFLKSTYGQLAQ
jgi:hypothetical protein